MKNHLLVLTSRLIALGLCSCRRENKVISTKNAPEVIGPYHQATVHGNTIYCSRQIAIDPKANTFIGGGRYTAYAWNWENE